jgi:isoquinoline 1-oxidoreductase beta subunit
MNINIKTPELSRRQLLAGIGGLAFYGVMSANGLRLITPAAAVTETAQKITPWVRIAPNGAITLLTAGAEMGQGSMTSLPMIIAEEMDADWSKVTLEWAPAEAETYGYRGRDGTRSMSISGSRAVQSYYADLRVVGAQVRKVLLKNAAEKWGVDPATLKTEPGVVVNPANGQKLTYGDIAAFGKVPEELPAIDKSELKPKSEFRIIGKAMPRWDIPFKVNGSAQYAIDVHLPDMLYATVLHAPVQQSEPESWNESEVNAMPGVVRTVKLKKGIAVVADTFEQAMAGRNALKVNWKASKAQGYNSVQALEDQYEKIHADPNAKVEKVGTTGDVAGAFAGAAKTFTAEYRSDYGYHAQMEPLNATIRFNEARDRVEVWDGSQAPHDSRRKVAEALGLKQEQVVFNQCYMGGGFGRRSLPDYPVEAALIAKEFKRPVKMLWTREEDLANGMFRPQTFQCLEAATDDSGKVTGWRHCVVGDGGSLITGGMKTPYYKLANQDLEQRGVSHGIRLKHWRAVAHVFNMFAIEGFVDEIAAKQGVDPIEFRVKNMAMVPRAAKCFETVAQMCDWKAPRPEGRAIGVALSERSGSLAAGAAEISLDRNSGKIKVHKIWLAVDGGLVVQPEAARANVESGILYGLSSILHERVTVKDGVVEQKNFDTYNLMRMSDTPEHIEVKFVERDAPPAGLGEIGNPFIPAAVANAFFKLTGKRLYHMPFTPERVKEALKA